MPGQGAARRFLTSYSAEAWEADVFGWADFGCAEAHRSSVFQNSNATTIAVLK